MAARLPLVRALGRFRQLPPGDSIPVEAGGTGATSADAARSALMVPGRNRLINGDCIVYQRASGDVTGNTGGYTADRWQTINSNSGATLTPNRDRTVGYLNTPRFWHKVVVKATATDLSTTKYCSAFFTAIEANDCYDMGNGPTCLSFIFYASISGNYSVSLRSPDTSYSFVKEFPVVANTPTKVTVAIPAFPFVIPAGTGVGLYITIASATNGDYQASTSQLGSWLSANKLAGPSSALGGTWLGVQNSVLMVTDVQYETGSTASPYDRRAYADELRRCQRYYEEVAGTVSSNAEIYHHIPYKVEKRETPSLAVLSGGLGGSNIDTGGLKKGFRCPAGVTPTTNQDFNVAAYSEIF